ncbi:sodium:calcium antiporter [Pontiella sulfatireligans]|uniref:Inner membrane protein YrbG n=1 Tax=Pontiella sulfatireligans TaxID=2750658 RepID=A0A6C2UIX4_9BACT|nr:sodium:calcium antiporter [Pontiella sulfatireligans]VGO20172.1 Inner membrane protein YrbG [Pontiella sulfatireligans]
MHFFEQLIGSQTGLVLAFLATAAVVVLAGIRLSIYGDALGDRTGLGSGLIGLVFLAGVTSLPELVVSLTSVIQSADPAQGADLAVGNMLGSNVFNLLILALMALLFPRKFDPTKLENPHTDSTVYGFVMLGIFSIAFATANLGGMQIPVLGCSWPVLALPIMYAVILRREHLQQTEAEEDEHLPSEAQLAQQSALRFYSVLGALCSLIIGGGILLSILGSRMALPPEQGGFGLEASIIGTIFLAISTSLPELVISFASVRMGFLDMAVGNVLGSNMFNLLIIFVADTALRGRSLLRQASFKNWTSVGLIVLLTLLAGALLRTKSRKTTLPIAVAMLLLYLAAMLLFM